LAAADCYADLKTTHLSIMMLISVSKLDYARPARDVEAGLAGGAPRGRELAIYFNELIDKCEAQVGSSGRRRGKTALASWYKFGQASSISPKFKQCERSSKFPNVMVTPSMLKKT